MSQDKLPFPEELPFSVNSSDTSFVHDQHDSQNMPIMPPDPVLTQDLSSPTYQPTGHDIICGRGRGSFLHEGNTIYLSLIRRNINAYVSAKKRTEKGIIISTMVSSLKERGFRFLRQNERSGGWYELSHSECYDRTAHAIRDLIRKKKKPTSKEGRRNTKTSASKSSSPTNSDSSVFSESSEKKPSPQHNEGQKVDVLPIPLEHHDASSSSFARLPVAIGSTNLLAETDIDSFDKQISQIPSEVMSPTDRLKSNASELSTPDDFA